MHLLEGRLDVTEPDPLRDEGLEREPTLTVEVDEHREVPGRQAVAIPGGLQGAAAAEDLDHRQGHLLVRGGDTNEDHGAGEVASVERLLVRLRSSHRLDDDIGTVASGEGTDALDRVPCRRVDRVRRPERPRHLQLPVVDVDGDHRRRPSHDRSRDRGIADPTAADHRDGVPASDAPRVDGCAESGHDAASEQANSCRVGGGYLRALTSSDEGLLDERPDAEGRGELGPIGEGHLLLRVVRREAVPRLALQTGPARTTDCAPVEDDEVTRGDLAHARPNRLDNPRCLVSQKEREAVVDATLAVVQVGVADPARLDDDDGLARPRIGHDDIDQLDRRPADRDGGTTHKAQATTSDICPGERREPGFPLRQPGPIVGACPTRCSTS